MSAEETFGALVCALGLCVTGGPAFADDRPERELPDDAFLEYLGLWEASDADWLLLDDLLTDDAEKRNDPVPEGEESTETHDEG